MFLKTSEICAKSSTTWTCALFNIARPLLGRALEKDGVELELLTDIEKHLFVERGMRGGISMVSKRYSKANNPLVPGFDPSKPTKFIEYLDANNLYGWAMSSALPKSGFRWKRALSTKEEILGKEETAETGWILQLILSIRRNCMKSTTASPFPEKKAGKKRMDVRLSKQPD